MRLDLLEVLNSKVNSLDLFTHSRIGTLTETDSIGIIAMPGGDEVVYMDGARDKDYHVQIDAKSKEQSNCLEALTTIYQTLENAVTLSSRNGSFSFNKITTQSLPSLILKDEQGYFLCTVSISIKITIYEGVL